MLAKHKVAGSTPVARSPGEPSQTWLSFLFFSLSLNSNVVQRAREAIPLLGMDAVSQVVTTISLDIGCAVSHKRPR